MANENIFNVYGNLSSKYFLMRRGRKTYEKIIQDFIRCNSVPNLMVFSGLKTILVLIQYNHV